ncbi:MAG: hypothetical protein AB7G62_13345 [Magnetospirillum sp.]
MGGFFSTPSAPEPAPIAIASTDPEEEARKQRLETMARNRRGRLGMVATGERGVLSPVDGGSKSLLGE